MILHFLTDEKFSDYVIDQFSNQKVESEFVLLPIVNALDLVKNSNKCRIVYPHSKDFQELLSQLDCYSAIILHGMHWADWEYPILKSVPKQVKVAWMFWGADVYDRDDIHMRFLAPISKLLYKFHNLKHLFGRKNLWQIPYESFKRIDYCLTDQEEEYKFVSQYIGNPNLRFIWYAYYSIEETLGVLKDKIACGNNIWLGNSATIENNHFEAILKLSKLNLNNRKLITPLSYGTPWVKNFICKIGTRLFKDNFVPLTTFLPRDKYNQLMLDCSVMIMPHYQPQAQGNIMTGLWLGLRVYLSEKSLTYQNFKNMGVNIYSLEKDFSRIGLATLSDAERRQNRNVLEKWYGINHVMNSVQDVIKMLTSN